MSEPISVSAYFYAEPGSNLEKACRSIFDARGGTFVGAGSWMIGPAQGERDVQYMVPAERVEETKAALKQAGFRLEPTPFDPEELEGEGIPDSPGVDPKAVEAVAGALMDVGEFASHPEHLAANPGWGLRLLLAGKDKPHDGDCTKRPYACLRCDYEEYVARAKMLLAHPALAPTEQQKITAVRAGCTTAGIRTCSYPDCFGDGKASCGRSKIALAALEALTERDD